MSDVRGECCTDASYSQLYEKIIAETSYEREMFTISKGGVLLTEEDDTELAALGMSAGKTVTLVINKSEPYKNTHFDSKKPITVDSVLHPQLTHDTNDDDDDNRSAGE